GLGEPGDRAHAPHVPAQRVPREIVARICQLRTKYPKWGSGKLRDILVARDPTIRWPAASTITTILHREGLPLRRRRARRSATVGWAGELTRALAPNHVWSTDFKGQFRLGDRTYCYPLTVSDLYSRAVLGCTGLSSVASEGVRPLFERHFQEYGLPEVIRRDHGVPFSNPNALAGLPSRADQRIPPGLHPERLRHAPPQQNG